MTKHGLIFSLVISLMALGGVRDVQAATYTLTITANHGSVRISPEKELYDEGETVELIPRPDVGYCFNGWTGDVVTKRLVAEVTMDSNKSITANFGTWQPPIGIPTPSFGIRETYRMYDDPGNRNPNLTYYESPSEGYYTHYIDNSHPEATDSGNPYGTTSIPRATLPNPLPAGSVLEIHGGPYTYVNGGDKLNIQADGTSTEPVFIRGDVNRPHFTRSIHLIGKYLVFENIYVEKAGLAVRVPTGYPYTDSVEHVCIRGCDVEGKGTTSGGGEFRQDLA